MYYCHRRKKGILDRQYVAQSVVFRKDMNYARVLQTCISVVFPDDEESTECEYYVANGRGISIHNDDFLHVDDADGQEERIS